MVKLCQKGSNELGEYFVDKGCLEQIDTKSFLFQGSDDDACTIQRPIEF